MRAAGDRRAYHHLFLSAPPRQQKVKSRQQRHEQRHAFLLTQALQLRAQLFIPFLMHARAAKCLHRGPHAIGGKLRQQRRTCQLFPPVLKLLVERLTA